MKYGPQELGKFFNPYEPLYTRKITDAVQLKDVLTGVLAFASDRPILAMSMSVGLYESHKELYLELVGDSQRHEDIQCQINVMRLTLKSVINHAPYNDYLITLWSCTGDIKYMIELVERTKSSIEEVSATAAWAIDSISGGSEIFAKAVDQAATTN